MAGWRGVDPAKWAGNLSTNGLTALLRNSVQALANEAATTIPNGGRVPVKTGNLARSVVVSDKPPTVVDVGPFKGDIVSGIAAIKPGATVYIGYQAAYARRMNYGYVGTDSLGRTYSADHMPVSTGYRNASGFGFAEAAAAKWPEIVIREAQKIASKMGSR